LKIPNLFTLTKREILIFSALIAGSFLVYFIKTHIVNNELTFLVPHIVLVSIAAWYLNSPMVGLLFLITMILWYLSYQTRIANFTFNIFLSIMVKTFFFIVLIIFINRKKLNYLRIRKFAQHDPLISFVLNKRYFLKLAQEALTDRPGFYALVYFDLDNFKQINDTYGHKTGDQALRKLSDIINSHIRTNDIFGRIGGDEFCIFLQNIDRINFKGMLERIQNLIHKDFSSRGWQVTLSIGVVTGREKCSLNTLIDTADKIMYAVKKSGKNNILVRDINDA